METVTRREFLELRFKPRESLCDDPEAQENQVCKDSNLKQLLDSGDAATLEWFREEQKTISAYAAEHSASSSTEGFKCLRLITVVGLSLKGLISLRNRLALHPQLVEYSHQNQQDPEKAAPQS